MKLLQELATDIQYIEEAKTDGKHLYISGVYLQGGIKNRNGRFYPPPVLDREATRYVKEAVDRGSAFGELGHPNTPGLNHGDVSHRITELTKDGNNWVGKAVVLPEGKGLVVKGIIETGGTVGVSSRGLGSLKEDKKKGYNIVQDDFRLMVGADIVFNPSAPDAWMTAVHENLEWVLDAAGNWVQKEAIAEIVKEVKQTKTREMQEQAIKQFARYMNLLKTGR
jgi:hypothetical protein